MTAPALRPAAAVLAALLVLLTGCAAGTSRSAAPAPTGTTAAPGRLPWPADLPVADPVRCPDATVPVTTSAELRSALHDAAPGTVIGLADGVYDGMFTATTSGTAADPSWLCGGANAVLRGPGSDDGTVLHLDHVRSWRLVGFTVRDAQKGVMVDGATDTVLQDLTVTATGDEAVHLRAGSTGNVVRGLTISDTGHRRQKFGEGVYVGSAVSNWCDITACQPDRSDRNVIVANRISATTAESVDIKEGTTGGVVVDNVFDGGGLAGDADSWVDVKGNGWLVQGNRGTTTPGPGFEVNHQADGWGTGNTFDANTADVRGAGFGFQLRPPTDSHAADNRVTCTNTAAGAAAGLSNITCG